MEDSDNIRNIEVIYLDEVNVYSWGKNKNGELGLGTIVDCSIPEGVETFRGYDIAQIASGGKHSVAICANGNIYSCGSAEFGVLGNYIENKMRSYVVFCPIECFEDEGIEEVACAEFHSLCRTKDGFVCSWGGNLYNKLGQSNSYGLPSIINSLSTKKAIQISCGDHHSTILTQNHELYTWGGGGQYNRGQCGHGDCKDIDSPKKISFFIGKIPLIVQCGGYHTIVVCKDNVLYGFGKGEYGQCGFGQEEDTPTPKQIVFNDEEPNDNIIQVSCGGEHSVLLSNKGRVYVFGHGYNGQLGLGDNNNYAIATPIYSLSQRIVTQIATGWSHTLILTSLNELYATGSNQYGELGLGDKKSRRVFTYARTIGKLNIKSIFAGGHHSFATIDSTNPIKRNYHLPEPLIKYQETQEIKQKDKDKDKESKDQLNEPKEVVIKQKEKAKQSIKAKIREEISLFSIPSNESLNKKKSEKTFRYGQPTSFKFDLQQLCNDDLSYFGKIILKVFYCDMPQCARYARFNIKQMKNHLSMKGLLSLIDRFIRKDNAIISHSLIDSNAFLNDPNLSKYKDLDGVYKEMRIIDEPLETKEYVLSIIYDQDLKINYRKALYELSQKDTYSPYEVLLFTEKDIRNKDIEKVLSGWVFDFLSHFQEVVEINDKQAPSFIELRPNSLLGK